MDPESSAPTFVALTAAEDALIVINLREIVMLHDLTKDAVTLEMSNGKTVTIYGRPAVGMLFGHLAGQTVILGGGSFTEMVEKIAVENNIKD